MKDLSKLAAVHLKAEIGYGLAKRGKIAKLPLSEKEKWKKYRSKVWSITNKQDLKKLPNHEKRAFNGHHLDHKVSIWDGFKNQLDPYKIGGLDNLEFVPHQQNTRKGRRSNLNDAKCLQSVLFT